MTIAFEKSEGKSQKGDRVGEQRTDSVYKLLLRSTTHVHPGSEGQVPNSPETFERTELRSSLMVQWVKDPAAVITTVQSLAIFDKFCQPQNFFKYFYVL